MERILIYLLKFYLEINIVISTPILASSTMLGPHQHSLLENKYVPNNIEEAKIDVDLGFPW